MRFRIRPELFDFGQTFFLPNGKLLETVLSSCQVEKTTRGSFENEQLICPTRVPGHAFPLVLRDAVIASEDQRFFSHGALDFRSTLRAAWQSLRGILQGGSTISQQLARSLLLKKEDSFERKLLEAVLAVRIAAILSREEILARYMNAVLEWPGFKEWEAGALAETAVIEFDVFSRPR